MINLKLVVFALVIGFGLVSCGNNESNRDALVRKRIIQKIEMDGMGMLKDLKIESVNKLNDSTYKGVHSFSNPIFNKEIRVTRNYTFTADLDSITKKEGVKTEVKSEGEWVETGF
ncbi:MAG: hypothetical protein Unbinned4388contig1000_44 [Prokaryotic dsDNA virus sp.]|nr:MAG: hypothetical protein Unbinned4388contig1000_44 [Prokaryotic dsDNA virus sp.]|tara:strand:- start:61374 stop:61718 length:345 start_codon:yes stop_codon:yes gene_type:complete